MSRRVPHNPDGDKEIAPAKRRFHLLDRLNEHLSMGPHKKTKITNKASADNSNTAAGDPTANTLNNATDSVSRSTSTIGSSTAPSNNADRSGDAHKDASHIKTKADRPSGKTPFGGSWRSKASPIAEIARESISASPRKPSGASAEPVPQQPPTSPTRYLSSSRRRSSKADILAASTTRVNVTSTGLNDANKSIVEGPVQNGEGLKKAMPDPPLPPDPVTTIRQSDGSAEVASQGVRKPAPSTTGWRGWWSRPDNDGSEGLKPKEIRTAPQESTEVPQKTPLPGTTPGEQLNDTAKQLSDPSESSMLVAQEASDESGKASTEQADAQTQSRSWFWLWSSKQNAQSDPAPAEEMQQSEPNPTGPEVAEDAQAGDKTGTEPPSEDNKALSQDTTQKPSAWAFWLRDKPKSDAASDVGSTHKQVGELAVADTPSQSHPEAAQFNEHEDTAAKDLPKDRLKSKRGRLRVNETPSKPSTPVKVTPSQSPVRKPVEPVISKPTPASKPNLMLPAFRDTYLTAQPQSYWQQIRRYFVSTEPDTPHLHVAPNPPRIRKALAIGVHGYFPAPLIQKVLGQPTGTSIRFANSAAAAIKSWTDARGYSCEIEKVALEGEGFIAERVDTLWKLLLNWIDHVKSSDFILVACHSQGVPVAIMLVAKLIQFGCVSAARVGVCAMAGVNLGPFAEYRSRFFGGSAAELFEFSNPTSTVSQSYRAALEVALGNGVRIVYIGSIDDQLVSLESSTFSNISHPYVYRAVFVDGRIHTPDFVTQLVGFTLKLRNLGIPDHGLIRELSPALAGSLYSGEGHSRIYDDPGPYDLAVQHALETTSLTSNVPLQVKNYEGPSQSGSSNPYFLPWAMRGLGEECRELLALFEEWKPQSKGLKDVRFRLEAVRSKL